MGVDMYVLSWLSEIINPVFGIALAVVIIVISKAIEHAAPQWLYAWVLGLIRRHHRWIPFCSVARWNARYITDDPKSLDPTKDFVDSKRPLSDDEIQAIYAQYPTLMPPRDEQGGRIPLFEVKETFDILLFFDYRVGWSLSSPEPDRVRLRGRFKTSAMIAKGTWYDREDETTHEGAFIITFPRRPKHGRGVWGDAHQFLPTTLRVFPWLWDKCEPSGEGGNAESERRPAAGGAVARDHEIAD